ncbi:hypothetical protein V6N13_039422 [Hibiscus sabdariffa]|uniref:Uncharacterized protein n=1 Tax=Hibiscus sabdariffa TaxID=183260 RepID=A0ABR2SVV2_9ROSI
MSIPNYKFQGYVNTINTDPDHLHDSFLHGEHQDDEEKEEEEKLIRFALERKPLSLSAPCSNGKMIGKTLSVRADLEDEKQSSSSSAGIEKTVRRVFSMSGSSASANQVYRRLDHPVADEENTSIEVHTQKGNKILETCRRFFGF